MHVMRLLCICNLHFAGGRAKTFNQEGVLISELNETNVMFDDIDGITTMAGAMTGEIYSLKSREILKTSHSTH